jgi:hypothetical protein
MVKLTADLAIERRQQRLDALGLAVGVVALFDCLVAARSNTLRMPEASICRMRSAIQRSDISDLIL